jgi:hypothetical protein
VLPTLLTSIPIRQYYFSKNTLGIRSHTQLRVFSNSLLDDLGNMLERKRILFLFIMTQSDIVCKLTRVPDEVHRLLELYPGLLKLAFLEQHTTFVDDYVCIILAALSQQSFGMLYFILFVANQGLENNNLLLVLWVLHLLANLQSLVVQPYNITRNCFSLPSL